MRLSRTAVSIGVNQPSWYARRDACLTTTEEPPPRLAPDGPPAVEVPHLEQLVLAASVAVHGSLGAPVIVVARDHRRSSRCRTTCAPISGRAILPAKALHEKLGYASGQTWPGPPWQQSHPVLHLHSTDHPEVPKLVAHAYPYGCRAGGNSRAAWPSRLGNLRDEPSLLTTCEPTFYFTTRRSPPP